MKNFVPYIYTVYPAQNSFIASLLSDKVV